MAEKDDGPGSSLDPPGVGRPGEILALLANQIPLSRFKDQIGFIQRCINQAASHLTNRKALQGAIKNRRLL